MGAGGSDQIGYHVWAHGDVFMVNNQKIKTGVFEQWDDQRVLEHHKRRVAGASRQCAPQ
jgi:hypothetical protein